MKARWLVVRSARDRLGARGPVVGVDRRVRRQGIALVLAVLAWALAVAFAGFARSLWLTVLLLAVAGAADLVSAVYRQTILQTYAPDEMRGRMQGVFIVVVAGGPRLGDLRAVRPPRVSVSVSRGSAVACYAPPSSGSRCSCQRCASTRRSGDRVCRASEVVAQLDVLGILQMLQTCVTQQPTVGLVEHREYAA